MFPALEQYDSVNLLRPCAINLFYSIRTVYEGFMSTSLPCKEITKIVASDLDGTLLAPNHQLSAYSKETLKALHEQGYTFVFATGRHHVDVASIRRTVGIPAYMITSNGARARPE